MKPLALLFLAFLLAPAAAGATDWTRYADEETIEVVTRQDDGSERVTTIWIVVVDGAGYIRTGGTSWGDEAERDPNVGVLRGEEREEFRVDFVEDDGVRETVTAAFREKYGFFDALISPFRGGSPRIMQLQPPEASAE